MLYADTGMTFHDLQLELASRVGLADHSTAPASLPSDSATQDLLKRIVNAGYDLFIRSNPKWRFMVPYIELIFSPDGDGPYNIDADPGVYLLPLGVLGAPSRDFTYKDTTSLYESVKITTWDSILRMKQSNTAYVGAPTHCAFSPHYPDGQEEGRRRWKVSFYPNPQAAYTITAPFRLNHLPLQEPKDRHVAGAEHDRAILAAIMYEWYQYDDELGDQAAKSEQRWAHELRMSMDLDKNHAALTVGRVCDPSVEPPDDPRLRAYRGVTKVSGIPVQ